MMDGDHDRPRSCAAGSLACRVFRSNSRSTRSPWPPRPSPLRLRWTNRCRLTSFSRSCPGRTGRSFWELLVGFCECSVVSGSNSPSFSHRILISTTP